MLRCILWWVEVRWNSMARQLNKSKGGCDSAMKNVVQYNAFLEEVLHAIAKQLLDDCGHYLLGNHMIMHAFARGHIQQRNLLFDIIKSKHCLMDITLNRDPDALTCELSSDEDIDACYAESTGARVKADSSVSLVYKYCEKIPRDNYFSPKPVFKFTVWWVL
ncbi:endoribonuclease Dicer homolog 3a-like isoform X2 [Elaeis guineensis]|uniref:endoribonuclease Dicer homolog 3a-like isoform X2 n=1 Tax=Elaeis guineensis var. tenera TaxID=51953 RepID=UPI003C6DB1A0